jgi:hydrogenase maturation protein HypF
MTAFASGAWEPALLRLPGGAPARVLACGAWLKNTACLLDGDTVYVSPLHGDLGTVGSREALQHSVAQLLQRASGPLDAVAHDLHPDFYSTELAQQLAQRLGAPAIGVQHHHAHLAQVAVQHDLGGDVLGWALDGVGLGTDQTAWGGEMLLVSGATFERLAHLPLLCLPGGDAAAREPWRMAASVLHRLGRSHEAHQVLDAARVELLVAGRKSPVAQASLQGVGTMLQRGLNCPVTSSAGRWFDAVAALLGLCWWQDEEAQAAVALERAAAQWLQDHGVAALEEALDGALLQAGLHLDVLMLRLLDSMDGTGSNLAARRAAQGQAAALFHIALADAMAREVRVAAVARGVGTVVLGGGCFFNRLLRGRMVQSLECAGLRVCLAQDLNVGDAGVAIGQAWVAAHTVAQARSENKLLQTRSNVCA